MVRSEQKIGVALPLLAFLALLLPFAIFIPIYAVLPLFLSLFYFYTPLYPFFQLLWGSPYDTTPSGKLTQKLWKEIESSTTKDRPFYENEYVICTVNRVPDSYWTLSKHYDNVHIVKLESLFATYNKDYNHCVHPRFVPSFV